MYWIRIERQQCKSKRENQVSRHSTLRRVSEIYRSKSNNYILELDFSVNIQYEVDIAFLQILIIRADMKCDDDLTRIVDTTISTFGQIDILVGCDTLRSANNLDC